MVTPGYLVGAELNTVYLLCHSSQHGTHDCHQVSRLSSSSQHGTLPTTPSISFMKVFFNYPNGVPWILHTLSVFLLFPLLHFSVFWIHQSESSLPFCRSFIFSSSSLFYVFIVQDDLREEKCIPVFYRPVVVGIPNSGRWWSSGDELANSSLFPALPGSETD